MNKSKLSFFKVKRRTVVSILAVCGIIIIVSAIFHNLIPKNPFLEHSESVETGVRFGKSNSPLYAGKPSETKTYCSWITFDEATCATQEQYIDFLKERVQGKNCDWYILYLSDRDTCIVYYNGDAHTGYYCKADDAYTVSDANLTGESPNLYGIVTWHDDMIQYESVC